MGWLADETGLEKNAANYVPLTPLSFLKRAADIHANRTAVVWKSTRLTYAAYAEQVSRLASGLSRRGIGPGDVVATLMPNIPPQAVAHFGVPAAGAILNTINTRLDADTVAYILTHSQARVLVVDRQFAPVVAAALSRIDHPVLVIDNDDPLYDGPGERIGGCSYEDFLAEAKKVGGFDLILDMVGGPYLPRNIKALATEGRLVQIAFLQGAKVELNFSEVMMRRLTITGSTLRPQSDLSKSRIAAEVEANVWPMIAAGKLRPVMDSEFALEDAAKAHARMESSGHVGKIVLKVE